MLCKLHVKACEDRCRTELSKVSKQSRVTILRNLLKESLFDLKENNQEADPRQTSIFEQS